MMTRRTALGIGAVLVLAIAAVSALVLIEVLSTGGFGSEPAVDLLVWFAPGAAILGFGLLLAAFIVPNRKKPEPPYRPL